MLKGKKQKKNKGKNQRYIQSPFDLHDMPSEDCKQFLVEFMVKFYEENSAMALESKFVCYGEKNINKFKTDIEASILQALHVSRWIAENEKRGFQRFLDERVHDSLWNVRNVLVKYGKDHRASDDSSFQQVILKADLFVGLMRPFAKSTNRKGSIGWWNSSAEKIEEDSRREHLVALRETANIIELER